MGDAAPIAGTIEKPTREQGLVINALGFLVAQVIEDDRWPMALDLIRDALPMLPRWDVADGFVPLMERLARAAERVVTFADSRATPAGAVEWMLVMLEVRAALAGVSWARACLLAPEPTQRTQPATL